MPRTRSNSCNAVRRAPVKICGCSTTVIVLPRVAVLPASPTLSPSIPMRVLKRSFSAFLTRMQRVNTTLRPQEQNELRCDMRHMLLVEARPAHGVTHDVAFHAAICYRPRTATQGQLRDNRPQDFEHAGGSDFPTPNTTSSPWWNSLKVGIVWSRWVDATVSKEVFWVCCQHTQCQTHAQSKCKAPDSSRFSVSFASPAAADALQATVHSR